jgi:phosphohistidine phosphatase
MKTLLVMRHAKSSHIAGELDDFERPLNKRGKREAPQIGRLLKEENLVPDLVVASAARRTRKTAELVVHESGFRGETRLTSDLYDASRAQLVGVVQALPDFAARVLLVGHNPGLEELLEYLTGTYRPLSTAALAQLEIAVDSWQQSSPGHGVRLLRIWQPRELA